METLMLDVFKLSPVLGILLVMWYYQRKDYNKLAEDTREDSCKREDRLQKTIDKNQEIINKNQIIISELVDDVKKDVAEIKMKLR